MQVYNKTNSISIKTLLLFFAVFFIAYLPVSSFFFFIKNDAFNGYFPARFFMSESIQSGHLPLWNPYINFGFPQYGDMSSGYWSPVTWLIASTIGYNAYIFTAEILLYILTGGVGVYLLCRYFTMHRLACSIAGISFMCCGFNIGHLQHVNWLSGIAILPWCVFFLLRLQRELNITNVLGAACIFYLFISSAHPTLIISAFYFLFTISVFAFAEDCKQYGGSVWRTTFTGIILMLVALTLMSAGMITGYMDIIPHFVRGEKLDLTTSVSNSSGLSTWISVLLPFSTVKNENFIHTDPSMRNHYMGLVMLLFILYGIIKKKNRWQWLFLVTGIVFLFLSSGGVFKTAAHYILPGMSYVRLNDIFSGISLLSFILFGSFQLSRHDIIRRSRTLKRLCSVMIIIFLILFLYGIINAISKGSILHGSNANDSSFAKSLVDGITFHDTIWIQSIIQMLIITAIYYALKKKKHRALLYICIGDMILASLLNIPFTGAGQASVADVQNVLNRSPDGIPVPGLQPISRNDTMSYSDNGLTGHWSMYGKQPGVIREVPFPITLKNTRSYFESIKTDTARDFMGQPFLFAELPLVNTAATPDIKGFTPGSVHFLFNAPSKGRMIYQQNYYPHWYYDDGMKYPVEKAGINFIAVPLKPGNNNITIFFDPPRIRPAMLISLIAFSVAMIVIVFRSVRRRA